MKDLEVRLHPEVKSYLDELEEGDMERCKDSLRMLEYDPFRSRPKCDLKKLRGRKRKIYRLRVGNHRFEYFVEDETIWIVDAFRRERGYR